MKIAFGISTLSIGGAERVATLLCNSWVEQNEVHLLTYQSPQDSSSYHLDERISLHPLDLMIPAGSWADAIKNNLLRINAVRRTLKKVKPDILVCFMTEMNIVGVISARLEGVPVVISERIHPQHHQIGKVYSFARMLVYPYASALAVQTRDIADWLDMSFKIKSKIIPNPVDFAEFFDDACTLSSQKIITVGRLSTQKGLDVLISAFAKLSNRYTEWSLSIYGEGELRSQLQSQIDSLGLADRITLEGQSTEIAQRLRECSIYAHSARYEGFPNAIVEACAVGKCVVATDAPGASRELLQDGFGGLLSPVDDVDAMAENLDRVMKDAILRNELAKRGRDAVVGLNTPLIAERWLVLFRDIVQRA